MSVSPRARHAREAVRWEAAKLLARAAEGDPVHRARVLRHGVLDGLDIPGARGVLAAEHGLHGADALDAHLGALTAPTGSPAERFVLAALPPWVHGEDAGDFVVSRRVMERHGDLATRDLAVAAAWGAADVVASALRTSPDAPFQRVGAMAWEPLLYAAWTGFLRTERADEVVRTLQVCLDAGAVADAFWVHAGEHPYVYSALTGALAIHQHLAASRLLLDAGADPEDPQLLFHLGQAEGTVELELLETYGLEDPGGLGLVLSVKLDTVDDVPGVRWLAERGADVSATLPRALERGRSDEVVHTLVALGADPTRVGDDGLDTAALAQRMGRDALAGDLA